MTIRLEQNRQYTPEEIVQASLGEPETILRSDDVLEDLESSREALNSLVQDDRDIYGVTTGFGDLVNHTAHLDSSVQGERLIYHLSVGTGDYFDNRIVRAGLLIRAITLSRGYSGIRSDTFDHYCKLISSGIRPAVPRVGSLGASGDLVPMANAVLSLMGEGIHRSGEHEIDAGTYLHEQTLEPLRVDAREALALVNGVPLCTAVGCFALERFERQLEVLEEYVTWMYASMGCSSEPFSKCLNRIKGHPDQRMLTDRLREKMTSKTLRDTDRPLQEVYSLRGVPQVLGAVHRSLREGRTVVTEELNGVDDNPIVYRDDLGPQVEHGANFIGQSLAFAFDETNEALTQAANLVERQLSVLLDSSRNGGFEPMLAETAGSNTGLGGAQLNATAILSSIRNNDQSYGSSSLTTNGGNQDVVPMAMEAGRNLMSQLDRFTDLLALHGYALRQYDHRVKQNQDSFPGNEPGWFPDVKPLNQDRPLRDEIQTIAHSIEQPIPNQNDL